MASNSISHVPPNQGMLDGTDWESPHEELIMKRIAFFVFVFGVAAALAQVPRRGYLLPVGEGESACCGVLIKASPRSGTQGGLMMLQAMPAEFSTGIHYHEEADEFFYVISGSGVALIAGEEHEFGPGDVMFVPAGEDHRISAGVDPVELLEFLDKPGLDDDFRAEIEEPLTLKKLNEVANRNGTVYKTLE